MKNVHDGLAVKNIYGNMKQKTLHKVKVKKYKMTEWEVFKKYNNLSGKEIKSKNNKEVGVRNDVITSVILHCRGEKNRGLKKTKKKMNSEEK